MGRDSEVCFLIPQGQLGGNHSNGKTCDTRKNRANALTKRTKAYDFEHLGSCSRNYRK